MKKIISVFLIMLVLFLTGCIERKKQAYLPEAKNDKVFTVVGGEGRENEAHLYEGNGYTISVPEKSYIYEKDYDDGDLEEKWEYTKRDDVEIKVTTYKNSDEIKARGKFLRDNEEYIFEDLTGYSICGTEPDGDILWFNLYQADGNVYIVSWEYPKNTNEELKKELSEIVKTFKISK